MTIMNADMDLFELVLFDVLIILIFACFLVTAVFFTGNNLFLIILSLAFGTVTFPCARTVGGWMSQIKSQEREKLDIPEISLKNPCRWFCLDFGRKGNAWMFRVLSGVTAGFAFYNLIKYFLE